MGIQHIAFVMDGNRRWARSKGMPGLKGHYDGVKVLQKQCEHIQEKGIKYMTVYALSIENLQRSPEELKVLFTILKDYLRREIINSDKYVKKGIRFRALGRLSLLPEDVQDVIRQSEEKTKDCDKFFFNACLAYNGQDEIVDAVKTLVAQGVSPDDITRESIKQQLYTSDIPPPDVIVRTGMHPEQRLSAFLLWDSSYAEFAFTRTCWPGLTTTEVDEIIADVEKRDRRFGK